ncbi:MAG: hypothetical protein OEQ53_19095, partial [Saprospiraceae bacterium]|nr:hypothetical protein [Saprospiraceae bacterium]
EAFADDLESISFLFIPIDGIHVPFHIDNYQVGNKPMIHFEGIDTPDKAKLIAGKELYAEQQYLTTSTEIPTDQTSYQFLQGFMINDFTSGEVGQIIDIQMFPQQEMSLVELIPSKKNCMVPLTPEFLNKWDAKRKIAWLSLPDGMLAL